MSEARSFLDGHVLLHDGDCRDVLKTLADNSIDSVVTDPPYHLQSITKRFATVDGTDKTWSRSGPHQRTAGGFMNKQWDGGDIAFRPELWTEVLRVLKPGGYIMAFSGCRTYHRMACAIEDAGFITHPMFAWIFGSGFPKAHSVSKQIDKARNTGRLDESRVCNWISAKCEELGIGRKDLDAAAGTSDMGGWWASRLAHRSQIPTLEQWRKLEPLLGPAPEWMLPLLLPAFKPGAAWEQREIIGHVKGTTLAVDPGQNNARSAIKLDITAPATDAAREWEGWFYGTQSLKPALEPIYFGQKPFSEKTGAANVLRWGTGAINVGASKVGPITDNRRPKGNGENAFPHSDDSWRSHIDQGGAVSARWPANLLLSWPQDEYELRADVTSEQKQELFKWAYENGL